MQVGIIEITKGNDLVFEDGHTEKLFIGQVRLYVHGRDKKEILKNLILEAKKLIIEIQNETAIVNEKEQP